jgi:type I restriction enzyme S subunit
VIIPHELQRIVELETLPPNWRLATLAEVGTATLGQKLTADYVPGRRRVPYIRAANVGDGVLLLDDVRYMSLHDDDVSTYRLSAGDIVVSEASGSAAQVGKAAIWDGSISDCCIQNTLIKLQCTAGMEPTYVTQYLRYARLAGIIAKASRGVGILHIGLQGFSRLTIPVPPTSEQRRIVSALTSIRSKLDDARARSTTAAEILSTRLEQSLTALLDERGTTAELRDICELTNGRAFKSGEWSKADGLPIIRIQNLWSGEPFHNFYSGDIDDRHVVDPGDLLFAWSGTPGTSFGPHVWNGPRAALNQHIFKVELHTKQLSRDFLYWWLRASTGRLIKKARGGGGLQHLRKNDLESLQIVIPDRERQAVLVTTLIQFEHALTLGRDAESKVHSEAESLEIEAAMRAFSGKLGTTNASEAVLNLVARPNKKPNRKRSPHPVAIQSSLRDAMLDALRHSPEPLTPTDWFTSTKQLVDVGAIDFNQMLVDLINEQSVDVIEPTDSANKVRYGVAS